jgi:hypothetical protein
MMSAAFYYMVALFINPFTGAALRNWQGCCLQLSETIALYLFSFLLISLAARFVSTRHTALKSILSWAALGVWCLGAPISFLHALS